MAARSRIAKAGLDTNPFWVTPKHPCGTDHGCDHFQEVGRQGPVAWTGAGQNLRVFLLYFCQCFGSNKSSPKNR